MIELYKTDNRLKDILGRVINDGDLVLKANKDCSGVSLDFGIAKGKSIFWDNGIGDIRHSSAVYGATYVIENPSEKELIIKNKISNKIK